MMENLNLLENVQMVNRFFDKTAFQPQITSLSIVFGWSERFPNQEFAHRSKNQLFHTFFSIV